MSYESVKYSREQNGYKWDTDWLQMSEAGKAGKLFLNKYNFFYKIILGVKRPRQAPET